MEDEKNEPESSQLSEDTRAEPPPKKTRIEKGSSGPFEDPDFNQAGQFDEEMFSHLTTQGVKFLRWLSWKRPKEIFNSPFFNPSSNCNYVVSQNVTGVCWLMTVLRTLIDRPDGRVHLEKVIGKKNDFADGSVQFNLYLLGKWECIKVDDRLPVLETCVFAKKSSDKGFSIFTDTTGLHGELWAALLQKALAKIMGSYKTLQGGYSVNGWVYLTGCLVHVVGFDDHRSDGQRETPSPELEQSTSDTDRPGGLGEDGVPQSTDISDQDEPCDGNLCPDADCEISDPSGSSGCGTCGQLDADRSNGRKHGKDMSECFNDMGGDHGDAEIANASGSSYRRSRCPDISGNPEDLHDGSRTSKSAMVLLDDPANFTAVSSTSSEQSSSSAHVYTSAEIQKQDGRQKLQKCVFAAVKEWGASLTCQTDRLFGDGKDYGIKSHHAYGVTDIQQITLSGDAVSSITKKFPYFTMDESKSRQLVLICIRDTHVDRKSRWRGAFDTSDLLWEHPSLKERKPTRDDEFWLPFTEFIRLFHHVAVAFVPSHVQHWTSNPHAVKFCRWTRDQAPLSDGSTIVTGGDLADCPQFSLDLPASEELFPVWMLDLNTDNSLGFNVMFICLEEGEKIDRRLTVELLAKKKETIDRGSQISKIFECDQQLYESITLVKNEARPYIVIPYPRRRGPVTDADYVLRVFCAQELNLRLLH